MKNRIIVLIAAAMMVSAGTYAQKLENDDMYFNSADRASLKAVRASERVQADAKRAEKEKKKVQEDQAMRVDPTANYTARNVNPEYSARSNAQEAQVDEGDYFVSNYQYQPATNFNNWNNSFSNWYGSSWYGTGFYNPYIYSWTSPYYASAYDFYGNPWSNPYYRSGWSSSFSYYYGDPWGYSWGPSYGYGYGSPYGYGSSWAWSVGFGAGWTYGLYCPSYYYAGGGYGTSWSNGDYHSSVAYGKRATRGGSIVTPTAGTVTRSRADYSYSSGSRDNSGGRVSSVGRTQTQHQEDYYNRSWRTAQQSNSQYPSRNASQSNWSNSNNNNSYRSSSGFQQSQPSYSPSRSSSSMGSGAVRSSAPASSGSNGRSRGRD